MIYAIEKGHGEDGLFLYLRNKKTGKCPGINVRWKWMCLHERQSGIDLPFAGFTIEHGKWTRKLSLYGKSSMDGRLEIGKVDAEWDGCKVWLFPTPRDWRMHLRRLWKRDGGRYYWSRYGYGIALHGPLFANLPSLPDYDDED